MKTLSVIKVALIPMIWGCQRSEEIIGEGRSSGRFTEVSAYDYSQNHFFVDTLYRSAYEPYFLNEPPATTNPAAQIVREEVWIERDGSYPDPNELSCRSFIVLPPIAGHYDPALGAGRADTPGTTETGPMVKLNVGEYTMVGDGYTGIITVNRPFSDKQNIAIAYRRADGVQIGEFVDQELLDSLYLQQRSLILHLVKPRLLFQSGPSYSLAWSMLVKSFYPLGPAYYDGDGVSLYIVKRAPGHADEYSILGQSLLNVLGLDRFSASGSQLPYGQGDGAFDMRPFRTIDPVRGEIIFPRLRPFDAGIQEYFKILRGGQHPDSTSLMPQIYDMTVAAARTMGTPSYVLQWRQH